MDDIVQFQVMNPHQYKVAINISQQHVHNLHAQFYYKTNDYKIVRFLKIHRDRHFIN